MYRSTTLTVLLMMSAAGCGSSAKTDRALAATTTVRDTAIREAYAQTSVPAAVAAVVTRDGHAEFVELGVADPDRAQPVTADSIFDIASMTKAITTVAALQMVEQGRVSLDEPLERIMPELDQIEIIEIDGTRHPASQPITLRDLLRHTAGFGYFFNSPQIAAELEFDPVTGWPVDQPVEAGTYDWGFDIQPRRVFEAGTAWRYGRNIGVAGRLVERLSGQDLDTYFHAHIFDPLGMDSSGFNPSPPLLAERVRMHVRQPETGEPIPSPAFRPDRMETFYGGGQLYSSPRDYARFLRCLLDGGELDGVRILSSDLVQQMMVDQLPPGLRVTMPPMPGTSTDRRSFVDEFDDGYSLGWAIEAGESDGFRPEGVGYWSGIHNTFYTIDSERGFAVLFFSQLQPFDDREAYELYRMWEDGIYRAVITPTE